VPLHYCADDRFRWSGLPSILDFHEGGEDVSVSITPPGGAVYHGKRVGDAVWG